MGIMFKVIDYVREMTVKKSCKYGDYIFLFVVFFK